jgi:hypothetical protein
MPCRRCVRPAPPPGFKVVKCAMPNPGELLPDGRYRFECARCGAVRIVDRPRLSRQCDVFEPVEE